jgi:hypothetical protein
MISPTDRSKCERSQGRSVVWLLLLATAPIACAQVEEVATSLPSQAQLVSSVRAELGNANLTEVERSRLEAQVIDELVRSVPDDLRGAARRALVSDSAGAAIVISDRQDIRDLFEALSAVRARGEELRVQEKSTRAAKSLPNRVRVTVRLADEWPDSTAAAIVVRAPEGSATPLLILPSSSLRPADLEFGLLMAVRSMQQSDSSPLAARSRVFRRSQRDPVTQFPRASLRRADSLEAIVRRSTEFGGSGSMRGRQATVEVEYPPLPDRMRSASSERPAETVPP